MATERSEVVLASIFVNPTQFAPNEDLDAYPRDIEGDLRKARSAGCAAVFLPSVSEMYSEDAQTSIHAGALAKGLCGESRPSHFSGVCTVVAKLLNIVGCDLAVFGQKDYQQLAIIRRMVQDLDIPVEILAGPIVRESDGLALSSRNAYLSKEHRREALSLSEGLAQARSAWQKGERSAGTLRQAVADVIKTRPSAEIDYIQVVDAVSLEPIEVDCAGDALIALAVRFGATRLIDNTVLEV